MDPGELAARERLEQLFRAFDRLTPDELARIGYRPALDEERDSLLVALDEAARRTGRVALMDEARTAVRESVMARYSAGSYHPTFAGLNWGLSQGTVEDRVGIAETLADAAAVAVVEDVLDPEIAAALTRDALAIANLSAGEASEGSLARAFREPEDPDLRGWSGGGGRRQVAVGAMVAATVVATFGTLAAAAVGIVAAVRAMIRRATSGR
jgi:hypothetical protein